MTRDFLKKRFVNPWISLWRLWLCWGIFGSRSFALLAQHTYLHLTTYSSQWYPPGANPWIFPGSRKPFNVGEPPRAGLRVASISAGHYLQSLNDVPVVPGETAGQSLCGRVAGRRPPVPWQFSAARLWDLRKVVDLTVQNPREWQWPGSWLHRRDGARKPTALMRDPNTNYPHHPTGRCVHAYNVSVDTQFSWTSLSVRLGF